MKFVNESGVDLSFSLSGVKYDVKAGGEIDVPDAVAFGVKAHKLPLKPSSAKAVAVAPAPKAEKK